MFSLGALGSRRARLGAALAALTISAGMAVGTAAAAPVAGGDVTYTLDADFDQGLLVNVNHDAPNNDQLQLNEVTTTFPFIWIALSQRCTIAKINTTTGAILGEYRTISDQASCFESSRTTVAIDGSVWVGHRGGGGVTHVGLVEANQCLDRNNNNTIETSIGYGDVKAWSGGTSLVANAADECILHHVDTAAAGLPGDSRHMSIDANNKLWVGDFVSGGRFIRVNGSTGAVETAMRDLPCGGYGGLIDGNGVIWSSGQFSNQLLRWNPNAPDSSSNPRCINIPHYGLAIDPSGNIWASDFFGSGVRKISPDGNTISPAFPYGSSNAQGLAVDTDGDVWVSSSLNCFAGCTVGHLLNNGTFVGNVPNPTGAGSTGVAIDAAGKPWTANRNSNNATRINPAGGPLGCGGTGCTSGTERVGAVDLTVSFPAGPGSRPLPFPYNYSDMTGAQLLQNTAPQGTWTVTQDSGFAGTQWGKVTWNTEPQGQVPAGSTLLVEVRSADTEAALGSQPFAAVSNGVAFSHPGRFIQVRVTFKPNAEGDSPVLSDIRIAAPPRAKASIDDVTVVEGNTGLSPATPATFTVSLDQATTNTVTVDYATSDGSAIAPGDYTSAAGQVTFAPGETSKPVTIDVVGDLIDEPTETFNVTLSAPVNATIDDGDGLGTILDDDRSGRFTCRATGLRALNLVDAGTSNAPNDPCKDQSKAGLNVGPLNFGVMAVSATGLTSSTNQTPDDLVNTSPALDDRAEADAQAANVKIVIGTASVQATGVTSHAEARCTSPLGGPPTLKGSSNLATLTINGQPIVIGNGKADIPLGLGVLHINHTSTTASGVTQRGIWFENKVLPSSLDIVVAEARAGYVGNPCL